MKTMMFSVAFVLAAVSGPAFAADAPKTDKPVQTDKSAPDYIRCVKTLETGSLVKSRKVCRTNAQWNSVNRAEARAAVDSMQPTASGSASGQ